MIRMMLPVVFLLLALLPGCAMSRQDQLRERADKIEGTLQAEQKTILQDPNPDGSQNARLSHLTNLRTTLSAAKVAIGAAPKIVPESQIGTAWDVLDEVLGTIEWNIPLGPNQPQRPLPAAFTGGVLNLNGTGSGTKGSGTRKPNGIAK